MFSRNKKRSHIEIEQHELMEHAQARIKQKKRLYSHFVVFLIGSVFLIIINKIFKYGVEYNWFVWAIIFWAFLFAIHIFNVFVTTKFMGLEWERSQREKLVLKQKQKIAELQKEIETEFPLSNINKKKRIVNILSIIAAAAENNALGKDNDLLWHLPDDFKRFKSLTSGHKIIMGRKTFDSFPKPLPNRTHIIITRDMDYNLKHGDCIVVHSMQEALNLVKEESLSFIIGGGEIYKLGLEHANQIELTRVHASFEADTFFPDFDENKWELIKEEYHPKDERHTYDFTYLTYAKKEIAK